MWSLLPLELYLPLGFSAHFDLLMCCVLYVALLNACNVVEEGKVAPVERNAGKRGQTAKRTNARCFRKGRNRGVSVMFCILVEAFRTLGSDGSWGQYSASVISCPFPLSRSG